MTYDVDRIRRVMKAIEAQPETFNMSDWARLTDCGTTMCLAGHTVADEGLAFNWAWPSVESGSTGHIADGRRIRVVAQELLGLSDEEAQALFMSVWIQNADQLWERIEEVTKGAVTRYDKV